MQTTNYFAKRPLWVALASALVAALMLLVVSFEGAQSARAADGPRIIGGTEVPDGKYPFMAFIEIKTSDGSIFNCGGSLIDRDSVLTAAHCLPENLTAVNVVVGRTVLSQNQGQIRFATDALIHPRYNDQRNSSYDAAVLKLESAVNGIQPIQLATSSQNSLERPGRKATVAGWGNTIAQPPDGPSPGSSFPDRMREAPVPLVSDTEAKSVYESSYFPSLMVTAGKTGKDACQGDSGGPMFAKVSGKYTQIGITSFGAGCGAAGFPGVYTEVNGSPISNFITSAASK
jgi:secreted trypsin-like serine protease